MFMHRLPLSTETGLDAKIEAIQNTLERFKIIKLVGIFISQCLMVPVMISNNKQCGTVR